ncbi:heparinase II/III domain-containing protein [Alloalcanivorax xenomutans]
MSKLRIILFTAWRLGRANIARALLYRLGLSLGLNRVKSLAGEKPLPPFYLPLSSGRKGAIGGTQCSSLRAFGLPTGYELKGKAPDWHKSIITGEIAPILPWWQIPDFVSGLGDIKGVWEISRFDWVLIFAKKIKAGDATALSNLNSWLQDWSDKNPPYIGVNWKCGQEASIRVMHLAMAAHILEQVREPASGLIDLIRVHLNRIAPTIQYAIAQDNNHGTSEAAALFIGGSWLASVCKSDKDARRWMARGRRWLENRARRLIEHDGSTSQYSLNYHRVIVDSYAIAELWRRALGLSEFSSELMRRLSAATAWMGNMVSPDGGDAPNLGVNDGARLLPLANTDHRDLRPSVQLASVLFVGKRAYIQPGSYDTPLHVLEVPLPDNAVAYLESRQYDGGGHVVMRRGEAMVLFRYPRFRFRPGQSDLLHVDFWRKGLNLLRDGGSYSYSCDEPWQSYFPGAAAHNTVQFDDRDAMPKISRFLFGAWPKASNVMPLEESENLTRVGAGYRDWRGGNHCRIVALADSSLTVIDDVRGFERSAVLRWRLAPGEWHWKNEKPNVCCLEGHGCRLRITASQPIVRYALVDGWESRYYSQKTPIPVLELEVSEAGRLVTQIDF